MAGPQFENGLKYALLGPSSLAAPDGVDNRLFRFDHKTPQRLVGAAALLAAAYTLFCILWPLRWSLALTWLVIELIFYVLYWRPRYAELNEQPAKHEPAEVDGSKTFQRFLRFCNELPNGVDYRAYFSGWFKGAPFEDIKRENAEDFMAYGFWYRSRQQMAERGLGHIPGEMVDQLEATWGVRFEPGFNSSLQFMGHLWEPLNAHFRPLAFYLSTEAVGWFARTLLRRWGFEHHKHNGLSYFTLNVPKPKPAPSGFHSRATSSSTLADVSAAAAVPGTAAPTVPGSAGATANGLVDFYSQAQQQQQQAAAGKTVQQQQQQPAVPSAAATGSAAGSSASRMPSSGSVASVTSSSGSGSSSSSGASGLTRSKSSPFEAGPPDWTPFADTASVPRSASSSFLPDVGLPPASAASSAAAASAAGAAAKASAGSSSSSRRQQPQQERPQPAPVHHHHRHTSPPLFSGLSTQTSVMLRHMDNPLERALSEGLGSADTPVLFLHGVGGLPAYLEMMLHVIGLGHPVIAVEFRGVAMRLGRVFTADEVADTVVGVMDKLGVKEACVVGHSYGTFIAGCLARHHRRRVHTLCLIDPVCFGMFMPHLLYNFLYRTPVLRSWRLHDMVEYVKDAGRLVASREMHVFATFARRFYWSDLNLWPEDLAPGSVVLLSGQDDLMDAAEVKDMLDVAGHVKVYYNQDLSHGAFLLDTEVKQTIMAEMRGLLARSGSAVVGLARPVLARTLTLMAHGFTAGGAPGNVCMKKGGGNGRYYVEDHGNQLVRTFTGNLTKMLASAGAGGFSRRSSSSGGGGAPAVPHFGGGGTRSEGGISMMLSSGSSKLGGGASGGRVAAAVAAGGPAGSRGPSGGGLAGPEQQSGASRLLQTFSGPVRRRFSSGYNNSSSASSSNANGAARGSAGGLSGGGGGAARDGGGGSKSSSLGGAEAAASGGAVGGAAAAAAGAGEAGGKRSAGGAVGGRSSAGGAVREGVSGSGRQTIHRIEEEA